MLTDENKYNNLASNTHLTKPVKIFKVSLVKSVSHYLNVHVIQVLQNAPNKSGIRINSKLKTS